MPSRTIPFETAFVPGLGVDFLSRQTKANPFAGAFPAPRIDTRRETSSHKSFINSSSTAERLISGIVEVEGSGWGANVSASVEFVQSQQYSNTSLAFVVGETVTTKTETPPLDAQSAPRLSDAAAKVLKTDPEQFVATYGTHFIGGFTYGGLFMGAINIKAVSWEQKSDFEAKLSVAISAFGGEGKIGADFQQKLKSSGVSYSLNAKNRVTGAVVPVDISSPDDMSQALKNFASKLNKEGGGDKLTTQCYSWSSLPEVAAIAAQDKNVSSVLAKYENVYGPLEELSKCLRILSSADVSVAQQTAQNEYVGQTSLNDLKSQKEKIHNLTETIAATSYAELDKETVHQRVGQANQILSDIDDIAQGRCSIKCSCTYDGKTVDKVLKFQSARVNQPPVEYFRGQLADQIHVSASVYYGRSNGSTSMYVNLKRIKPDIVRFNENGNTISNPHGINNKASLLTLKVAQVAVQAEII